MSAIDDKYHAVKRSGHRFLVGRMDSPLMGMSAHRQPERPGPARWSFAVKWPTFEKATYDALTAWRPSVFADLWKERLALSSLGSPFSPLMLDAFQVRIVGQDQFSVAVETNLEVPANGPLDLKDWTLYDLQLNLPVGFGNHVVFHRRRFGAVRFLRAVLPFFRTEVLRAARSGSFLLPVSRFHSSKVSFEIFPSRRSCANLRR